MKVGNHPRVMEYDGASYCYACGKMWGIGAGNSPMPEKCEREERRKKDRRIKEPTAEQRVRAICEEAGIPVSRLTGAAPDVVPTEKGGAHVPGTSGIEAVAGAASAQTRNLAPDVAAMVKQWASKLARQIAHYQGAPHFDLADHLKQHGTALIEQLGQGWMHPVSVVPRGYVYIAAGTKGVYTHTDKSDWFYTYTLPPPPERP